MFGVLDRAVRALDQRYREDPGLFPPSLEAMQRHQTELGNLYGGQPIGSVPSPLVLDRAAWAPVQDKVRRLRDLLEKVALELVSSRQAGPSLGFRPLHLELVEASAERPGRPAPLARIDGMISPEGRFQVVEVNTDGSTGVHDCYSLAEAARRSPAVLPVAESEGLEVASLYEPLATVFRTLWEDAGESGAPRVAIVDWETVKSRYEQQVLAKRLSDLGVPAQWCDPRALERKRGRLVGPEGPVDILYKRVLSAELLERRDEVGAYLDAILGGEVLQVDPFTADILYDKGLMALVQGEAGEGLSPEEKSLVEELVPFARPYPGDGDLTEQALAERETLVLKPRTEYGGKGVVLGNRVGPREWEQALTEARGGGTFLLQRYLEPNRFSAWVPSAEGCEQREFFSTTGIWIMGDETPGIYFRAGPSPVINVSGGAYGLPVLFG